MLQPESTYENVDVYFVTSDPLLRRRRNYTNLNMTSILSARRHDADAGKNGHDGGYNTTRSWTKPNAGTTEHRYGMSIRGRFGANLGPNLG